MDEITLQQLITSRCGGIPWQDAANILLSAINKLQEEYDAQAIYVDVAPSQIKLDKSSLAVISCGDSHPLKTWDTSDCADRDALPWEFLNKWSSRTEAAQVYPLAGCLYFSVCGELPPSAEQRLNGAEMKMPAERGIDVPPDVDAVLLKALALNACERYTSLAEFKAAVLSLTGGGEGVSDNSVTKASGLDLSKIRTIPAGKGPQEVYHPTESHAKGLESRLIYVVAVICAFSLGVALYQLRARPSAYTSSAALLKSEAVSGSVASDEAAITDSSSEPVSADSEAASDSDSNASVSGEESSASNQTNEASASKEAASEEASSSKSEAETQKAASKATSASASEADSAASKVAASSNATQTVTFDDGSKFVGTVNGTQYTGTVTAVNGDVYSGTFVNGLLEGQGTLKTASGNSYKGNFVSGKANGSGTMTYADGSVYTGNWSNGERSGSGTLKYTNGDSFKGNWTDDQKDGSGTYTWANGSTYSGLWSAGKALQGGTYNYTEAGVTEWLTSGRLTMQE